MTASGGKQLGPSESVDDRASPQDSLPSAAVLTCQQRVSGESKRMVRTTASVPLHVMQQCIADCASCTSIHMPPVTRPQLIRHCLPYCGMDGR